MDAPKRRICGEKHWRTCEPTRGGFPPVAPVTISRTAVTKSSKPLENVTPKAGGKRNGAGRKRVFGSRSAKQRAYRERKRVRPQDRRAEGGGDPPAGDGGVPCHTSFKP